MESFLEKKSPVLIKGWQKRYFVYCEGLLLYFKNKVDLPPYTPKGVIKKQNIVQVDYLDPNKNEFIVYAGSRKFYLKAESKEIKEKWLDVLKVPFNLTSKSKSQLQSMQKTKWSEVTQEQIMQLYLKREEILQEFIEQQTASASKTIIKSANLDQAIIKMGEKNKEFFLRTFINKKSLKNPLLKKQRWLVLFTSISMDSLDQIHKYIEYIPQQYSLDTIILLKCYNNLATLTKSNIEIYQIQNLQLIVTNEYMLSFNVNGRFYEIYFNYLSDARRLQDYIIKCQQINNSMPVQIERTSALPVFKMDDRKSKQVYFKGKILMEGQVEKKVNATQWKNVVLTLKENHLLWEFIDTDQYSSIEIKQILEIEQTNRIFTIKIDDETTALQMFRTSSIQETNEWTGQLAYITDKDVVIKTLEKASTLQNYQLNSLQQSQQQQQQTQKQQPERKPSFFEQLFCWGGERKQQVD